MNHRLKCKIQIYITPEDNLEENLDDIGYSDAF